MPVTGEQVLDALRVVQDPDLHRDIVALGFIKDLEIDGPRVCYALNPEALTPLSAFITALVAPA